MNTVFAVAEIEIDEELAGLIPPLTEDERRQLEANILADGCRDPLAVWAEEDILLDGHNRYRICQQHDVPFDVREVSLPDRDAAKRWIILNQFGRRNLTPYQRAELALKLEPLIAAQAREKQRDGGAQKVPQNSAEAVETRVELARVAGVSYDTITRAKFLDQHADDDTKRQLRAGETSINAAVEAKARERMLAGKPTDLPPNSAEGDARDVLASMAACSRC
jgi:hypothetical protein